MRRVDATEGLCCRDAPELHEQVFELAEDMATALSPAWRRLEDVLPLVGLATSFGLGVYVVVSHNLQSEDSGTSLLEWVFCMAVGCTGLAAFFAMLTMRSAVREADYDPEDWWNELRDGLLCQLEGACVAFFQLSTILWITAGSHSVFRFVCSTATHATVRAGSCPCITVKVEQDGKQPEDTTEKYTKQLYMMVCFGVPFGTVFVMLVLGLGSGAVESFSFQRLADYGWCSVNMDSPLRTLLLFYLPMLVCMFYSSACYYFCWEAVKSKKGMVEQIEEGMSSEAGAQHIQDNTTREFETSFRASRVVRLSLVACTMCWMPPSGFALLSLASQVGAIGGDETSMVDLAEFHGLGAMVNAMFGLVLYLTMEACFNLRQRYFNTVRKSLRRLRWKICGPPSEAKRQKMQALAVKKQDLNDADHHHGLIRRFTGTIVTIFWQALQLVVFAPWAIAVWLPMETFRAEIKSNKYLAAISTAYMACLALPSIAFLVLLPQFYELIDGSLAGGVRGQEAEDTFQIGFLCVYLGYFVIVGFIAVKHIEVVYLRRSDEGEEQVYKLPISLLFSYLVIILAPFAIFAPEVGIFHDINDFFRKKKNLALDVVTANQLKHSVSRGFSFVYMAMMFAIVGAAIYKSWNKTELNYIQNPHSHVQWTTRNGLKLLGEIVMNIQLSSLLLTNNAFAGGLSTGAGSGSIELFDADTFRLDFGFLKGFMLDAGYFEEVLKHYREEVLKGSQSTTVEAIDELDLVGTAYDMKLNVAILCVLVWVAVVMIPIVVGTISMDGSNIFQWLYGKISFVQEILAGPLFLLILQTFMAGVDCTKNDAGTLILEAQPWQACWEGDHLMYATVGLTGLMAFVPLACLTMGAHEVEGMDFRVTPLYYRVRVLSLGVMAMACQFSNTISPMVCFPIISALALINAMITYVMKPCCIFWANGLLRNAHYNQLWTAVCGMFAFACPWGGTTRCMSMDDPGVPLWPAVWLLGGWGVIALKTLMAIRHDRKLLARMSWRERMEQEQGNVVGWSDHANQAMRGRDKLQIKHINHLQLAIRPEGAPNTWDTHHQILCLIYVLKSDANATTKQRALQILSSATDNTSAVAVEYIEQRKEEARARQAKAEEAEATLENTEENVYAITMQNRRRLMGVGGSADLDQDGYHFPQLVLRSPMALIDLLAEEFNLTRARDETAKREAEAIWLTEVDDDDDDDIAEDSSKKRKWLKVPKLKRSSDDDVEEVIVTDAKLKTDEIVYLMKRTKALVSEDVVAEFNAELPQKPDVKEKLSFIRNNPPDILRLAVSGAGSITMGADKGSFKDEEMLKHILALPQDRIFRAVDEQEEIALANIRAIRRMYAAEGIHGVLGKIQTLPPEMLDQPFGDIEADDGMSEDERKQSQLLQQIARMEKEKKVLDNEINLLKDSAISNVAKTYLVRVVAMYAQEPQFCKRIMATLGAEQMVEFLLHGDSNLQTAATVCLYQMSQHDQASLDPLQDAPGVAAPGLVFVATQLTHPEKNSTVTHRIAVDLMVEVAKRFELRGAMIQAGLVGPLVQLADHYAQCLLGEDGDEKGSALRAKIEEEIELHQPPTPEERIKRALKTNTPSLKVNTVEIEPWCPFELADVDDQAMVVLMTILRVFQQLSEEDTFRAEFVGRHGGLEWIVNDCWPLKQREARIMALRVLMGMATEPFGFYDIIEDDKMIKSYLEMKDLEAGASMTTQSRDKGVRMRVHRVAEFLMLDHRNETRSRSLGPPIRMVTVTKLSDEDTAKRFRGTDEALLEIVRERAIEECFEILDEGSKDDDDNVRDISIGVLSELCARCQRVDDDVYDDVWKLMGQLREDAITLGDVVQYEGIVSAMIKMMHNHRLASDVDDFKTVEALFESLWLFHHSLGKDLKVVAKSKFFKRVQSALSPGALDIVIQSQNTAASKTATLSSFREHPDIHKLYWEKQKQEEEGGEEVSTMRNDDIRRYVRRPSCFSEHPLCTS